MGIIIGIIVIFAIIGGIMALCAGGKAKDVATTAAGGAIYSMGCIAQLILLGLAAAFGLWLLSKIL